MVTEEKPTSMDKKVVKAFKDIGVKVEVEKGTNRVYLTNPKDYERIDDAMLKKMFGKHGVHAWKCTSSNLCFHVYYEEAKKLKLLVQKECNDGGFVVWKNKTKEGHVRVTYEDTSGYGPITGEVIERLQRCVFDSFKIIGWKIESYAEGDIDDVQCCLSLYIDLEVKRVHTYLLNVSFGGFGLSNKAIKLFNNRSEKNYEDFDHDCLKFRSNAVLIGVVEKLKLKALGPFAGFALVNVTEGPDELELYDYDGQESLYKKDYKVW